MFRFFNDLLYFCWDYVTSAFHRSFVALKLFAAFKKINGLYQGYLFHVLPTSCICAYRWCKVGITCFNLEYSWVSRFMVSVHSCIGKLSYGVNTIAGSLINTQRTHFLCIQCYILWWSFEVNMCFDTCRYSALFLSTD